MPPLSLPLLLIIALTGLVTCIFSENSDECSVLLADEDRAALWEYIVHATRTREATSLVKLQRLRVNIEQLMEQERNALVNAESNEDLFYSLVRLSNARRDRHLSVKLVKGGIWLNKYWGPSSIDPPPLQETPIKFATDYSNQPTIFVADYAVPSLLQGDGRADVEIGDVLVAINHVPFPIYVKALEPYVRYSTIHGFWCKVAEYMNQWNYQTPPSFYQWVNKKRQQTYTLERPNGTQYNLTLDFVSPNDIQWLGYGQPTYPGFFVIQKLPCITIYRHESKRVLLLVWHSFEESLIDNVKTLMEYAVKQDLIEYALILDLVTSRGGSKAPYAIQHLTRKSFQTTFGNLKLSDITKDFIKQHAKHNLSYYIKSKHEIYNTNKTLDDGMWLMDWLETSVLPALRNGDEYTNNVPFKLTHAHMHSDGVLHAAPIHFSGDMVALFGPFGGSQVDQFASILVDNELAHTIGMSTGGFSNTWDWSEILMTSNQTPLVSYMWSIGQTIRPNGQVLEGNPAEVDEYVALTRENYMTYRDELVSRAMRHLGVIDDIDE